MVRRKRSEMEHVTERVSVGGQEIRLKRYDDGSVVVELIGAAPMELAEFYGTGRAANVIAFLRPA